MRLFPKKVEYPFKVLISIMLFIQVKLSILQNNSEFSPGHVESSALGPGRVA